MTSKPYGSPDGVMDVFWATESSLQSAAIPSFLSPVSVEETTGKYTEHRGAPSPVRVLSVVKATLKLGRQASPASCTAHLPILLGPFSKGKGLGWGGVALSSGDIW